MTYKETHYNAPVDPQDPPTWTGTWMDPRFSPPADGGQPQNALTGQLFVVNSGTTDITVPAQYSKLRFWRNTRVASLASGQSTTLDQGVGTLGYEWDVDADNGFRPAGLMDMSSTTNTNAEDFTDYGGTTQTQQHRDPPPDLVPGAERRPGVRRRDRAMGVGPGQRGCIRQPRDPAMQQATVNLFADMGAQPTTLMSGLTAATASTDTTAPDIDDHLAVAGRHPVGRFGRDHQRDRDRRGRRRGRRRRGLDRRRHDLASGHHDVRGEHLRHLELIPGSPTGTLRRRSSPGRSTTAATWRRPAPGTTVNVNCPCSIWGTSATPKTIDSGDAAATEVGVKFKTDTFGVVTGIRFYKASTNTGTHVGNLWTANGQLLASATFTGESASGWQQVNFAQPVALNKNTTYVASYFAPKGHYSQDGGYFYTTPKLGPAPTITNVDSPPLHALRNTNGVVNGVFSHSGSSTFPTSSVDASNYWVDPVFTPQTFTTPPGQVGNVNATAGYASASRHLVGSDNGRSGNDLHDHALHRIDRTDPDHGHREPGADLRRRVRPDQRHDLYVHGHRVQPGRHGPGVRAVQRGDTVSERRCTSPTAASRTG